MSYLTSSGRAATSLSSARVDRVTRVQPKGYKWIRLGRIDWTDPFGRKRVWEMAERCHNDNSGDDEVDGVAVLCLIRPGNGGPGAGPDVLFVSQFRPPIRSECVELPAGLIDEGEDAVSAALRELTEETGYAAAGRGAVRYVSGPCPCDPGMSNASMQWVVVDVDGTRPTHREPPRARPDDGEFIRTYRVPLAGALEWLEAKEREGMVVDARLYGLMIGLCRDLGVSASRQRVLGSKGGELLRVGAALAFGALLGGLFTRAMLKPGVHVAYPWLKR